MRFFSIFTAVAATIGLASAAATDYKTSSVPAIYDSLHDDIHDFNKALDNFKGESKDVFEAHAKFLGDLKSGVIAIKANKVKGFLGVLALLPSCAKFQIIVETTAWNIILKKKLLKDAGLNLVDLAVQIKEQKIALIELKIATLELVVSGSKAFFFGLLDKIISPWDDVIKACLGSDY